MAFPPPFMNAGAQGANCGVPNPLGRLAQFQMHPSFQGDKRGRPMEQKVMSQPNPMVEEYEKAFTHGPPPSMVMKGGFRSTREKDFFERMHSGDDWSQQYDREMRQPSGHHWAQEYQQPGYSWANEYQRPSEIESGYNEAFEAAKPVSEQWADEYQASGTVSNQTPVDPELVDRLKQNPDPRWRNSKFVNFLDKLSTGEVQLRDNDVVQTPVESSTWAAEFTQSNDGNGWVDEYGHFTPAQPTMVSDQWAEEYSDIENNWVDDYTNEFDENKLGIPDSLSYEFAQDNPYTDLQNPLERAMQLLANGQITEAILAFEAAAQKNPENAEIWRLLGQCHADNEDESRAIAALLKCIQLDAYNLEALLLLGVSYSNDLEQSRALNYLKAYIKYHPDYQNITAGATDDQKYQEFYGGGLPSSLHDEVVSLFNRAAAAHPGDPDLLRRDTRHSLLITGGEFTGRGLGTDEHVSRVCSYGAAELVPALKDSNSTSILRQLFATVLGVLYHISHDYDKAIACFGDALKVKPQDPSLWNKLGATQANSDRSEQAISAYKRALELRPNYTRVLANLGISYANQNRHEDAASAYLTTLAKNPNAEHIWSYLRLSLSALGREDLVQLSHKRQPALFSGHFSF